MIENLVMEWFFQQGNKKYLSSNNQIAHYSIHLFSNWMRQTHQKTLEKFLKIERCETEIATAVIFLVLVQSIND